MELGEQKRNQENRTRARRTEQEPGEQNRNQENRTRTRRTEQELGEQKRNQENRTVTCYLYNESVSSVDKS